MNYTVSDKTDALFNLAQALQSLGEMISESGPSTSLHTLSTPENVWQEARAMLEQLIQLQLDSMNVQQHSGDGTASSEDIVGALEADAFSAPEGADAVTEEHIVTPSNVIESILSAVQILLSLAEHTGQFPAEDIKNLLEKAMELDRQDGYMNREIQSMRQDAIIALAEIQLSTGTPPDLSLLQDVIHAQRQELTAERRPDPAVYSNLADSLIVAFDSAILAEISMADHAILVEAIEHYDRARTILDSPFQRPASTLAHHIPALLSANFQAASQAYLTLAVLSLQRQQSQGNQVTSDAGTLIQKGRSLAIEGLNILEGSFKGQFVGSEGILRFTRAVRSSIREDYRTVIATRASVFWLTRFCLYQSNLTNLSEATATAQTKGLHALLKATFTNDGDLKHALDQYVTDSKSDGTSRLFAKQAGNSEENLWKVFVGSTQ